MWNPKGNTLPKCKWKDHIWKLTLYEVVSGEEGSIKVLEVFECPKCLRLKIEEMAKEMA